MRISLSRLSIQTIVPPQSCIALAYRADAVPLEDCELAGSSAVVGMKSPKIIVFVLSEIMRHHRHVSINPAPLTVTTMKSTADADTDHRSAVG